MKEEGRSATSSVWRNLVAARGYVEGETVTVGGAFIVSFVNSEGEAHGEVSLEHQKMSPKGAEVVRTRPSQCGKDSPLC